MLKRFWNQDKNEKGFSLVELLVVIVIVGILAGIATTVYLNERTRSYLTVAVTDGKGISDEITSIVSDYTLFGTQAAATTNTITIVGGALTFSAMTAATGSGLAVAAGPATSSAVRLSSGTTVAGVYGSAVAGIPPLWCIIVTNNSTYAKFTNVGLVSSQVGGTAPTCSAAGS